MNYGKMMTIVKDIKKQGFAAIDNGTLKADDLTTDKIYMIYDNDDYTDDDINKAYYDNEDKIQFVLYCYATK